jgi:starvation-inducible DNA-binding protein
MNSISEVNPTAFDASLINLTPEARAKLIDILNQTLATTVDLKTQVKQAQWNVTGIDSYHYIRTLRRNCDRIRFVH